jgi:hypothetical protein
MTVMKGMTERMPAKTLPNNAPRNSEAKKRPPRKPEPMEKAEAVAFMISMARTTMKG